MVAFDSHKPRAAPAGVVPWGTAPGPPAEPGLSTTGIYVVALTAQLNDTQSGVAEAPISPAAVDGLLAARPELTVDKVHPTREDLTARLAAFWFPDEVVLYIGLAGSRKPRPPGGELAHRVGEYYKTRLGDRSPHAGGWPLKTLTRLDDLYVHYAYCDQVDAAEKACIGRFAKHMSTTTLSTLHDPVRVMPFANLEFPKGSRKNHGIRGARAPRKPTAETNTSPRATSRRAAGPVPARPIRSSTAPPRPSSAVTQRHRSQVVTVKDIDVGQVRIPVGPTKAILPAARADVTVVLRDRGLGARRWDPRYGTDKERSGVIRVGKAAATELLTPGDVLAVSVDDAGVVALD
jgi:hypothetical protein